MKNLENRSAARARRAAIALSIAAGAGAPAFAQPVQSEPASVLVYPLFDSRDARETILVITDTSGDRAPCDGNDGLERGGVRLHFVYYGARQSDIDRDPRTARWLEFDRYETLTPGDTIAVRASEHDPDADVGFLTVKALSPDTDEPIDFDFLVGSAIVADAASDTMWSYVPYSFQGVGNGSVSTCGHELVDGPGTLFDGLSYCRFPDVLLLDSFVQERPGVVDGELTLMSTSGSDYVNDVEVLLWNNREERFSRQFSFRCWTSVPLSDLSAVTLRLGGDPDESAMQTGWLGIDGRRVLDLAAHPVTDGDLANGPAVLGVFRQAIRGLGVVGRPLQYAGGQDTSLPH